MTRSSETIHMLNQLGKIKALANTAMHLSDDSPLELETKNYLIDVIEEIATKSLEVSND